MANEEPQAHWNSVYASGETTGLGWYTPHLALSLDWIAGLQLAPEVPILDAGGGASTLVDDLLAAGHRDLTVVDLASRALEISSQRLGAAAVQVTWRSGDILALDLPAGRYALWHDRAVFHFLTDPGQRDRYLAQMRHALRPDGYVMMGVFAPEAPARCSGLPVQRYALAALQAALGDSFTLLRHTKSLHVTPGGVEQMYLYALFRRSD